MQFGQIMRNDGCHFWFICCMEIESQIECIALWDKYCVQCALCAYYTQNIHTSHCRNNKI